MKNWIIEAMDSAPSKDGLENVVVTIYWRRQSIETVEEKEYSTDVYGSYSCPEPDSENFVSYDSLTKEQVEGWLEAGLDVEKLDESLDNTIEWMKNPPVVKRPLPF